MEEINSLNILEIKNEQIISNEPKTSVLKIEIEKNEKDEIIHEIKISKKVNPDAVSLENGQQKRTAEIIDDVQTNKKIRLQISEENNECAAEFVCSNISDKVLSESAVNKKIENEENKSSDLNEDKAKIIEKIEQNLSISESFSDGQKNKNKTSKYQYGNYDRYYGYRNFDVTTEDVRLEAFKLQKHLFNNKDILDIGCNNGFIPLAIAKDIGCKSIIGLDIDHLLIAKANKSLRLELKKISDPYNSDITFPKNIKFTHANYILPTEVLLEMEQPKFDVITCLSVTKWIHLNSGDDGLKLCFKRMYKQLKPNGILILEAQNWKSYKRRKLLTENISKNFKLIKFQPHNFEKYLLGPDVGFNEVNYLPVPPHLKKGFQRPIQIYTKHSQ